MSDAAQGESSPAGDDSERGALEDADENEAHRMSTGAVSPDRRRVPTEIDLGDTGDDRAIAIGRVPANTRVLLLGTGDVPVVRALTGMGCRVWGVGLDGGAAAAVAELCEEVVEADLEDPDLIEVVGDREFDVVLVLGLLERLGEPAALLHSLPKVLAEGGWAVLVLPNVAHASVRLDLLRGTSPGGESEGSRVPQMRLFDRSGVDDLLEQTGWGAFDLARVISPLELSEQERQGLDPSLVHELETDIEALTLGFVVAMAPIGSRVLREKPVLPAATAQSSLSEAMERIRTLEVDIELLREHNVPGLTDRLEEIRLKVFERRAVLKDIIGTIRDPEVALARRSRGGEPDPDDGSSPS